MTDVVIKNTTQVVDADGVESDEVINRTFRCVMDGKIFQAWLQVTDEPEVLFHPSQFCLPRGSPLVASSQLI